ncbi:glycosyltransferase family 2 protein [Pleomorphovibrio marinus]|uniref:glycosyltransferase family 2 protein n=1 Tax=Pleomorphovibrio marinus TaxID=2164132 RepID=UPI000E0B4BFA|nr:glycosyltransferase family 2 protein [Pleomorphovibrio marinus]
MNTHSPLVSIALCTYNGQNHLTEQLDSLVNQTYTQVEIIVVDDQSNDNTVKIVEQYQKKHPHIHLTVNPENLGYQKNFEKAFALCKGEYICPSDQDDIWMPNKVALMVEEIGDHLLIYHDSAFVSARGELIGLKMSDKLNMVEGKDPTPFLFFNCVSGHSMMFHRKLLTHILPLPPYGVYDHYISFIATSTGKIKFIPKALVMHRQHEGNATDILGRKKVKSKINVTLERMQRENHWLKICADKNLHETSKLAAELYEAARQRTDNFINIRFGYLVYKHQDRLMYIPKNKSFKTISFAIRQIWGAKAKALWKRK